jgi:hypothetical protein
MNHDERYKVAVTRFVQEPEALTQEDLDALRHVDEALGERAIVRRAEFLTKAADVRHRAAMGLPAVKKSADDMAIEVIDTITLALAQPRRRLKALETLNSELSARVNALANRLLELEAQRAIDHVEP